MTTRCDRRKFFPMALATLVVVDSWATEGSRKLAPDAWRVVVGLAGVDIKSASNRRVRLIVFFDPNCPVCAQLWLRLYGEDSPFKDVATRWVPVAYFSERSLGMAAAILSTASSSSLAQNFTEFDHRKRVGAAPEIVVTPKLREQVRANVAYWERLGGSTPLLMYRANGGEVHAQLGLAPKFAFDAFMRDLPDEQLRTFK